MNGELIAAPIPGASFYVGEFKFVTRGGKEAATGKMTVVVC